MAGGLGCGDKDNSHLKEDHSSGKKICRGGKLQNQKTAKCLSVSGIISWEGERDG